MALHVWQRALRSRTTGCQPTIVGVEAVGTTPHYFGEFIKKEMDRLGRIVREAGIKPE